VEEAIISHAREFQTHFVAESPDKLRRLPRYYAAQLGEEPFPSVACNAPWASAVIEADGAVRPCFFHRTIGNVREHSLKSILRGAMVAFRRGLDVSADETCRKCVCSLKVGWRSRLWP
jgi:MoaA/NifB/PqqE/SkfB family radical SAM enzyme